MKSLSITGFVTEAAAASSMDVILVQTVPDGSAPRLRRAFLALAEAAIDDLLNDGLTVLQFTSPEKARESFDAIIRDMGDNPERVSAEITLVGSGGKTDGRKFGSW